MRGENGRFLLYSTLHSKLAKVPGTSSKGKSVNADGKTKTQIQIVSHATNGLQDFDDSLLFTAHIQEHFDLVINDMSSIQYPVQFERFMSN